MMDEYPRLTRDDLLSLANLVEARPGSMIVVANKELYLTYGDDPVGVVAKHADTGEWMVFP